MTALLDNLDQLDPLFGLRAGLAGELLTPTDPEFAEVATPWNVAVRTGATAVVVAENAADVAAAVRFAGAHGLQVIVQSTGHGAVDNGYPTLMVQTGRLQELSIDPSTRVARVGAGVRWSAVMEASAPFGLAGLAGSAPHVGVVGYLTGGGFGPVVRTFGSASDRVVAFEVVTGDGELRRATATENPALFWGLRGGKGALGIVTAVEFELVPVSEIYGGTVFFAGSMTPQVLSTWASWTAGLPDSVTSSVAVMRLPEMPGVPAPLAGQVTVAVRYAHVPTDGEDPDLGARLFAPILAIGEPVLGGVGPMPYAAIGSIHADPVDPMPVHETSGLLRELPAEAVERLVELTGPGAGCPQIMVEIRHLGGALRRPVPASALGHREAEYNLMAIGIAAPGIGEAVAAHGGALLAALEPWATGGILPNFAASADPALVSRKYDRDTLTRLATLVTTFDPRGVLATGIAIHRAQACFAA